tara:strand:+ start:1594 stop:2481 length:888 start_codon:yes stop_codon:yes gene_type:complete
MKRKPSPATSTIGAYIELMKPNITIMIVISTSLGFYLGSRAQFEPKALILTLLGSFLVSGGAGALNHFAEQNTDSMMDRTSLRPIQSGLVSSNNSKTFGIILTILGTLLLFLFVNKLTSILALLTTILYLFVYTPLKRITWLNTSIGAIPGSLPPVGGWVAASGKLDPEAWVLFAILFFWQHPHFFAIAYICKDDYKKAKLKMLPAIESDGKRTNRQIIWHALLLIPVSLMPFSMGLLGGIYFWGAFLLGIFYLLSSLPLLKNYSFENARLLLKASVFYLPTLLAIIIIDSLLIK